MGRGLLGALLLGLLVACKGGGEGSLVDCPSTIAIVGLAYSPANCQIKAGSSLTIEASAPHPLRGLGADNPIPGNGATTNQTVVFSASQVGKTFEYECINHSSAGMKGSIKVVSP
jgi:plastocyanin